MARHTKRPKSVANALLVVAVMAVVCVGWLAFSYKQSSDAVKALKEAITTMSSHQCEGDTRPQLLCKYKHVLYFNGTIYYIGTDSDRGPPIPSIAVPNTLLFEPSVKLLTPEQLQNWTSGAQLSTVDKAIVWHRSLPDDMYHSLWENVGNIHVLGCKRFQRCAFDPYDNLQLLFLDGAITRNRSLAHAELWRCVSSVAYEEAAATRFQAPVLVRELLFGIGLEMQGSVYATGTRDPPRFDLRESWHERMRTCMGLSPKARVGDLTQPQVTFVYRVEGERGSGWTILNHAQAVAMLQKKLPNFKVNAVAMTSNMSLQQQVELFSSTSLFISLHDPYVGNAFWLPLDAVLMEVDRPMMAGDYFYERYVVSSMKDVHPIGYFRVPPSTTPYKSRPSIAQNEAFQQLSAAEQQAWLGKPNCDHKFFKEKNINCLIWLRLYCDVELDVGKLEATLQTAAEWLYNHGVARPKLT